MNNNTLVTLICACAAAGVALAVWRPTPILIGLAAFDVMMAIRAVE